MSLISSKNKFMKLFSKASGGPPSFAAARGAAVESDHKFRFGFGSQEKCVGKGIFRNIDQFDLKLAPRYKKKKYPLESDLNKMNGKLPNLPVFRKIFAVEIMFPLILNFSTICLKVFLHVVFRPF